MTTAYHSRDKRCSAYSRPKNKKLVEQQLRDYLEKTYGDFYVADEVTLGPYCSDWVHDVVKKKGELEKLTDEELVIVDLTKETWWDKNRRERWEKQRETNS
jgi:hypothetical protein|tara:strand:+ start:474 stop:776 length:303 start_codon:yes stop_codon:yes gene_type:complete